MLERCEQEQRRFQGIFSKGTGIAVILYNLSELHRRKVSLCTHDPLKTPLT